MSGVQDGTFCGERVGRVPHWGYLSLLGLAVLSGCQSLPDIRGQSPAFDEPTTSKSVRASTMSQRPMKKSFQTISMKV